MRYERPTITDFGSIADHTFMPVAFGKDHKGFTNCTIETTNCELSHPEGGNGDVPLS